MGMMQLRSGKRVRVGRSVGLSLLGLLLLGVGVAGAQEGFGSDNGAASAEAAGNQQPETAPALTPEQMLQQSRSGLERMELAAENIRRLLREAREAKDVVKALCLDDKLTQMDVAKRSTADRLVGLESAVQTGNKERLRHEFAVITALRERAEAIAAEANQCIGEETGALGDAEVVVTIDPDVANTDPIVPTDTVISVPPVLTSPTL
jgi:hypothetical protein